MSGCWRHIYHVITCVTNELKGSAAGDIINHSAHQVEGTSCASSQNWDLTRKTLSDFCCFRFSSFADAIRAKIMESYPITRSRFLNYAKVFNGILYLRWGELSEGTGMWIIRTINHVLGKEKNEKCEAKKSNFSFHVATRTLTHQLDSTLFIQPFFTASTDYHMASQIAGTHNNGNGFDGGELTLNDRKTQKPPRTQTSSSDMTRG